MTGVNFQPGSKNDQNGANGSNTTGVQEAIKVLSLRLPKVVGARAVAPGELLNAQGSGGNPMIDSVVNQVLARYFPTEAPMMGQAPGQAPVLGPGPGESSTMPPSRPIRAPHVSPGTGAPPPAVKGPTADRPPNVTVDKPLSPIAPPELPMTGGSPSGGDGLFDLLRKKNQGGDYDPTSPGMFPPAYLPNVL